MNLSGIIIEHQNSLMQLYLKLERRFEENGVIQALWRDMAGDVSLQISSLKSLPPSFWNQLKKASGDDMASAVKNIPSPPADVSDISLRNSFEISLQFAEPVVLKIYARVIRLLRKNSTAPSLDFYIMVKAYTARLARTAESFAGDPLLVSRARMLLANLEKEIQEPSPEIMALASKVLSLSAKTQKTSGSGKTVAGTTKETTKKSPQNAKAGASKPAKTTAVKTKTLSGKTPATTKRAQR